MTKSWSNLKAEAPELAVLIERIFDANLHHILGTIKPDGSPRLSGSEVDVTEMEIRVGMMPDAHKLRDVLRDPRVEIHAAPLDVKLEHGDMKLTGVLQPDGLTTGPEGFAFYLDITKASVVRVDGDQLEFTVWRPGAGVTVTRRS